MKKLLISLALVLFTSVCVFSQKAVFNSDRHIVEGVGTEVPVEADVQITIERGVVVVDPGGDNEHTNLLIANTIGEDYDGGVTTYYFRCVDRSCNKVLMTFNVYDNESFIVIGFESDNISIYYRGNFEDAEDEIWKGV